MYCERDSSSGSSTQEDNNYYNRKFRSFSSSDDDVSVDSLVNQDKSSYKSSSRDSDNDSEEIISIPKKRSRKLSNETLELLKQENLLRRSSRARNNKKPNMYSEIDSGEEIKTKEYLKKRRNNSFDSEKLLDDSDGNSSISGSSDTDYERTSKRNLSRKHHTVRNSHVTRQAALPSKKRTVNYKDDSGSDLHDSDVLEWEYEEEDNTRDNSTTLQLDPNAETVEKVMNHRYGIKGATGSETTCYNVEEKGDPNSAANTVDKSELELQFLIKWVSWSHIHNTWESEASLKQSGAKGLKKVENYIKKQKEIDEWLEKADKEYIEYYDCEQEMNRELYDQYRHVERVIAHQVSREKEEQGIKAYEYLIKWCSLSYSECSWESEDLIKRYALKQVEEYHKRMDSTKIPSKSSNVLKKRPKFVKQEGMLDFLREPGNTEQELRDYQLEGVNWMLHAWCKGNSCILADEMGLGKTIQTISFTSVLFHVHQLYGPFLFIVPLSTMGAWYDSFIHWGHDMNVVTYMGDVTSREIIRQYELFVPGTKKLRVNGVLTTYEILLKDKSFLSTFQWALLAVDEAHRLKNDESLLYTCLNNFSTNHRLLITGTPLQNSLKELWSLLHFISPNDFYSWPDFETAHKNVDHQGISSLHKKLEPYLLRRVKKDVEKSIPLKVEQILRVEMTRSQKQFYKWILTKNYKELSKGVKGSFSGFVNLMMELKKCCNHSSLVKDYDYIENDPKLRLQQLLKCSGKLILLDKLLCRLKETGSRVLIFSQMVMMLDILQEYLKLRRFQCQRLDGSMRSDLRKQALDHFNAPGSTDFCFLLSTRAGGLGINLATANTVIIFDSDWNPQNDLQAMCRAHRIGQKKQVNIYRLVSKGTVEEEIVERAKQKLVLDHLVIQRMDTTGKTILSKNAVSGSNKSIPFDKNELNAILKFGAAELFKEENEDGEEPEVDIDTILQGAETRLCEQEAKDNDLLSAFKYANFAIDEEKDLALVNEQSLDFKDWSEIIPEADRKAIEAEEHKENVISGVRQRIKIHDTKFFLDDGDKKKYSSDSESDDDRKRKNFKKPKVLLGFTEAEVKKFVKSLRKFGRPLERISGIAEDAELEDHSQIEITELAKEILRLCNEITMNHSKSSSDNGSSLKKKNDKEVLKIANLEIPVRPLLKSLADLEILHVAINHHLSLGGIFEEFKICGKLKSQVSWDVPWNHSDDNALIRGVYKHGMGNWDAIKMDPDLGLTEKIYLKDKIKKPQPKHLHARAEAILKHINRVDNEKTHHKKVVNSTSTSGSTNFNQKIKKHGNHDESKSSKHTKHEKHHDQKAYLKSSKNMAIKYELDNDKYSHDLIDKKGKAFTKCVEILKPVSKYITKLLKSKDDEEDKGLKYLLKLGDHITGAIKNFEESKKSQEYIEKWFNYLWIFLSSFIPGSDSSSLYLKYLSLSSNSVISGHHKASHHHYHSHDKDKKDHDNSLGSKRPHSKVIYYKKKN
ncbi:Chromodomain-helicase-DNA-binding protein 1 [Strongyloides ratti]|uniref:Chromodomain-helicase-DNA-binding protein 1 n=1 Tax=Strongyloides ratti TaxID=34506 RepID=A0A090LFW6_STRRB|nr:Chromodomain-helicase-DNA-binding protein 1 [Strongyloides ratti]CEF66390.1 Chromodomain-helicase-DNA-binding protein 1 [Strongyloides ratti]